MSKSKSKTGISSARKANQGKSSASHASAASSQPTSSAQTKHARIVAMLRSPAGTTIAAVMKETGWQQHSVRGFFAGVVRKKLKLNLVSAPSDHGRVYRVRERQLSRAAARKNRAA
jgi:hypothetical protein